MGVKVAPIKDAAMVIVKLAPNVAPQLISIAFRVSKYSFSVIWPSFISCLCFKISGIIKAMSTIVDSATPTAANPTGRRFG